MTKSTTCNGKEGPLTEYASEWEAQDAAKYIEFEYGKKMVEYRCKKCELWHLSLKSRHTPSEECPHCNKSLYRSEAEAQKRADILYDEQGVSLRIYECPHESGWHLTKNA